MLITQLKLHHIKEIMNEKDIYVNLQMRIVTMKNVKDLFENVVSLTMNSTVHGKFWSRNQSNRI